MPDGRKIKDDAKLHPPLRLPSAYDLRVWNPLRF